MKSPLFFLPLVSLIFGAVDAVTVNDPITFATQDYDYIVVGTGCAGMAIASLLSENFRVGVIEAGPVVTDVDIVNVPGMIGRDEVGTYDWNYTTVANNDTGVPSVTWPRGKILGGSSALNYLVWNAGAEIEYDILEQLGNPDWNWDTLSYYRKQAETWTEPSAYDEQGYNVYPSSQYAGHSGPTQVSFGRYVSAIARVWVDAMEYLGINRNNNPLSGTSIGVTSASSNIRPNNQTRHYSAPAYYFPVENRETLTVIPESLVTRVNFQSQGDELIATGVTFMNNGQVYNVTVSKDVIISAGSVNTAQILELSGIGEKDVLDAYGIEQLLDLPVGENLQDHCFLYKAEGIVTLDDTLGNATFSDEQLALWQEADPNNPSIFAMAVPSVAYLNLEQLLGTDAAQQSISQAEQFVASQNNSVYYDVWQAQLQLLRDSSVAQAELLFIEGTSYDYVNHQARVRLLATLQHSWSRGYVHIQSNDPTVYPLIQPNYLASPLDVQALAAGVEYTLAIGKTVHGCLRRSSLMPNAPGNTSQYSDILALDQNLTTTIDDWIHSYIGTEYHPIGTASMLPQGKGGVVDPRLIVYGTKNLRVVDMSILPIHIGAHPMATIVGIAQHAAAFIKEGY
ncbi:GMC oxidoreductase [Fistulina hepatica ATCC 64428]|uniref:GMC oxidoreductase n=1 Tax=Fistulina hepatica ATCC 64428 TaxID=1128425 RepID=A0A0D7A579_9AGAR|nr:GMC oxidoreductase [Fistulina hepatica ATCC 64428]